MSPVPLIYGELGAFNDEVMVRPGKAVWAWEGAFHEK
jgi:hypothetical protein